MPTELTLRVALALGRSITPYWRSAMTSAPTAGVDDVTLQLRARP
jgi:hypothetical protein